jgi:hypothetical protein
MWRKYLSNSFALWADMLHIKDIYVSGRKMVVGDGKRTHFWGDS